MSEKLDRDECLPVSKKEIVMPIGLTCMVCGGWGASVSDTRLVERISQSDL